MKTISLVAKTKIEIREAPVPRPARGQVAIDVSFVGLCGTDLHVYLGEFEERVRYPAVLGHEFSGTIAELGDGVDGFARGDIVVVDPVSSCGHCPLCRGGRPNVCQNVRVFGLDCDGALAQRVIVDAKNVFHLPKEVEPAHAVMTELYAVAVHASRIAKIEAGDTVVILGAGRLGLSLLDVMLQSGARRVVSVDILESRLLRAREIGAHATINAMKEDPVAAVMDLTSGLGADKVVEAVGKPKPTGRRPPMVQAVQMLRPAGQILAMGQPQGEEAFEWRPFVLKEATILSSRLNLGDMPRALAMMRAGKLHPDRIITSIISPAEVKDAFDSMHDSPEQTIKAVVDMSRLE